MATKLVVKVYVLDFVFSDNEIKGKKRKKIIIYNNLPCNIHNH